MIPSPFQLCVDVTDTTSSNSLLGPFDDLGYAIPLYIASPVLNADIFAEAEVSHCWKQALHELAGVFVFMLGLFVPAPHMK